MITNEEARKAIEKYQEEHPLPFGTMMDVTAISSEEDVDIISQTIERISKQMEKDTELWCICEMAKMYMQGVRPVYPVRTHGKWILDTENSLTIDMFRCSSCGCFGATHFKFCPNCGADMGKEADNENKA